MNSHFKLLYENGFISVDEHIPTGYTVVRCTDAIAILIHVKGRGILLVEQDRPAMITKDNPTGTLIEAVAGRFDVNLSPAALAVKEIEEEVGGAVQEDQIVFLNEGVPLAAGPGLITDKIVLAYAELNEAQVEKDERTFGHAEEGEKIRRLFVPLAELGDMTFHDMKTYALVQWFLRNHDTERAE